MGTKSSSSAVSRRVNPAVALAAFRSFGLGAGVLGAFDKRPATDMDDSVDGVREMGGGDIEKKS